MEHIFEHITFVLLLALFLAKFTGYLFSRIHLPSLVGEICGGIVIGNLVYLGFSREPAEVLLNSPFFQYAKELGVVFLLFLVGLESNVKDLVKSGGNATVVALIGVILPMTGGVLFAKYMGWSSGHAAILIGATLAATSVGITAKLLSDVNKIKSSSAQIILGAAVIDDVLGLIILAIIGNMAQGGAVSFTSLSWLLIKIVLFFSIAILLGRFVMPKIVKGYDRVHQEGLLSVTIIVFILIFSRLAQFANLAPIIGAFTAGLILDEVTFREARHVKGKNIEEIIKPLSEFLLPLFFVIIGVQVDLSVFVRPEFLFPMGLLLLIAILGKTASGFFCYGKNIDRFGIGFGMIPRGEVGLIFASFGLTAGIINRDLYSLLVVVVLLTTVIGPLLLKTRLGKF